MYLEEKIDIIIDEQNKLTDVVLLFLPNLETEKGVVHIMVTKQNRSHCFF